MNQNKQSRLFATVLAAAAAINASASGFRLADQDAFATGRGEAFVATADNPSAIYYNPAGLTQLSGNNLRGGIYGIYLDPGYHPPSTAANAGQTYYDQNNLAAVPQFFYSSTLKNLPVSFGLGVYAPFGGNISWPQDTGFRTAATDGSLTYLTINPAVAVKPLPGLSLGAGLMLNYVDMDFEQGLRIYQFSLPPNFNFYKFTGDGWSFGYNLGLLWQPIRQISLGATFRSSARVNLDGHSEFAQPSAGISDTSLPAQMALVFPWDVVGGLSYRPTTNWNAEFDADYTDWSSFGTTTIYQEGNFTLAGPGVTQNPQVNFDWQGSWMFECGVTRYFPRGWHASAGYVFSENSVPNAYYTPLAADLDRHFISAGVGHRGKRFDFDLACQFGYGPSHTVTDSSPPTKLGQSQGNPHPADGTYDFISGAVLVTVGLHF
ncbi:MAG: outer membrane protein transport protein [Verrucomicrobiota bacterium]|jgi:long-chain fatty acid transport protein